MRSVLDPNSISGLERQVGWVGDAHIWMLPISKNSFRGPADIQVLSDGGEEELRESHASGTRGLKENYFC